MMVVRTVEELRRNVGEARKRGLSVALVPTMGFLHDGHLALIDAARGQEKTFVVVSIFVNPTQFAPTDDLDRYPRDEEGDRAKLESGGTDLVFCPAVSEMYPGVVLTSVRMAGVALPLEGERRPGHFDGVATVVLKLFNLVQPDWAFFGQKDAQQCAVIRRMVADLNVPVGIVTVPTVREEDGLAMSSRNVYLSKEQRSKARALHDALESGRAALLKGKSVAEIEEIMRQGLSGTPGAEVDYLALVDPETFLPPGTLDRNVLLVGAIRLGGTRLIDNVPVARYEMPCRSTGRTSVGTSAE